MTELADFLLVQNTTDPTLLEKFSKSSDATIRMYVAENSNTPLHVLETLASDRIPEVSLYVVRNPNITNDLCRLLTVHPNPTVKREAVILAIRRYQRGKFDLEQKELFAYIKILDPKANNLDAIEALVEINEANERTQHA